MPEWIDQIEKNEKTTKALFSYNVNPRLSGFTCQNLLFDMYSNLIIFVIEHLHLYL